MRRIQKFGYGENLQVFNIFLISFCFFHLIQQNGRDPSLPRKPTDKKNKEIDEVFQAFSDIPDMLGEIGATPRNNEMGKTYNLADMNQPSIHRVSA